MQRVLRYRLQAVILLVAIVVATAGLFLSGAVGGSSKAKTKVPIEPIAMSEPFIINLADTDSVHYVKLALALQLEPMTEEEKLLFEAEPVSEGHGGGAAQPVTGPVRVAADPTLRDAVINTVARFTAKELLTPAGKEELKRALLRSFDQVAQEQAPHKAQGDDSKAVDPAHPPFHIENVYFSEYAVQ